MYAYMYAYVRRSKLNSYGEVTASLHKAAYRSRQSQHPFHDFGSTQQPASNPAPSQQHPAPSSN